MKKRHTGRENLIDVTSDNFVDLFIVFTEENNGSA